MTSGLDIVSLHEADGTVGGESERLPAPGFLALDHDSDVVRRGGGLLLLLFLHHNLLLLLLRLGIGILIPDTTTAVISATSIVTLALAGLGVVGWRHFLDEGGNGHGSTAGRRSGTAVATNATNATTSSAVTTARPLAGLLQRLLLLLLLLPAPLRAHLPGPVLVLPLLPSGGLGLGQLVEVVPGLNDWLMNEMVRRLFTL